MANILDTNLERLRKLNTGVKRLLFIGYVVWWIFWLNSDEVINGIAFLIILLGYWILILILLWVIEGFRQP